MNINSLRNKINNLREIINDVPLVYLVNSKTKLDDSFPNAQFTVSNYDKDEEGQRQTRSYMQKTQKI